MANKKKKKAIRKNNVSKKGNNRKKKVTKKTNKNSRTRATSSNSKSTTKNGSSNSAKSSTKNAVKKTSATKRSTSVKNNIEVKESSRKKKQVNKKIIIFITILILLIISIVVFLLLIFNSNRDKDSIEFQNITLDEYLELYKSEELEFIYLYHNSCLNCDVYETKLSNLEAEYKIKIKKLDYSKLKDSELEILKSSNSILEEGLDVPMILSIKGKDEISSVSGVKEYDALKNFVIFSTNQNSGKSFTKIDIDDYLYLLGSKDKTFIYICDSSDDDCEKFTSVLENVTKDRKIKVNYLNTNNFISSDDWDKIESSSEIYKNNLFMPIVLIIKNGKIVDYKMENLSEKDLINFLTKNGL